MKKRRLYLHLGLPKTATTYLQRHIFSEFTGVNYLGRFDGLRDFDPFIKVFANYFHFYPKQELLQGYGNVDRVIADTAQKLFPEDTDTPLFISDEGLTFRFFDAFDKQWYGRSAMCSENFFERLDWYARHGAYELRLILVLRKQVDWLPSFYAEKFMQLRKSPATAAFDNFIEFALGKGYYMHGMNNLDYQYLSGLMDRFDSSAVCFVPYERLRTDPDGFVAQIAEFMGAGLPEGIRSLAANRENQSHQEGSREYQVRVDIRKDPYYFKLKKIKRKLFGDQHIPLSKTAVHGLESWRYPDTERNFTLTGEIRQRIEAHYQVANEQFLAAHPDFEPYWK